MKKRARVKREVDTRYRSESIQRIDDIVDSFRMHVRKEAVRACYRQNREVVTTLDVLEAIPHAIVEFKKEWRIV
jgi:histone H3/H4